MKINLAIAFIISSISAFSEKVDTIEVAFDKTVFLYFDAGIKGDPDLGHPDLIGEVKGSKLSLRSAVGKGFPETNVFVETETGAYVFVCVYKKLPKKLLYQISTEEAAIVFSNQEKVYENGKEVSDNAGKGVKDIFENGSKKGAIAMDWKKNLIKDSEYILSKRNEEHEIGVQSNKLIFSLGNMFVNDKYMYFKVDMKNLSYIKYDIDFLKFVVRNKKGSIRKNAVQDEEKIPAFVYNNEIKVVDGKESISKVFVFEKFTMDPKESFHFEIWEVLGDRKVEFKISSNKVLSMRKLY